MSYLKFAKFFRNVILIVFIFSPYTWADRNLRMPLFSWHDWIWTTTWCSSTGTFPYQKVIEYTVTNISSTSSQTVTINCTGLAIDSGGKKDSGPLFPTGSLKYTTQGNIATGEVSPGTLMTQSSGLLGPGGSAKLSFSANYRSAGAAITANGSWHLLGSLDCNISVAPDAGAIVGVLNSTFEDGGCADFTGIHTLEISIMALRNTPRTILLNGGRPF